MIEATKIIAPKSWPQKPYDFRLCANPNRDYSDWVTKWTYFQDGEMFISDINPNETTQDIVKNING